MFKGCFDYGILGIPISENCRRDCKERKDKQRDTVLDSLTFIRFLDS